MENLAGHASSHILPDGPPTTPTFGWAWADESHKAPCIWKKTKDLGI